MISDSTNSPGSSGRQTRAVIIWWILALTVLCGWTAWRLGAFETMVSVISNGRTIDVPNIFSTIDHPFHATRVFTLLQSLENHQLLRWVGNHQGGYPVEFYPLGVAWLEVGIWAIFIGSLPILAAHQLAVIFIFLVPAIGFWILAKTERVSPGVAVLATAMHIAIPGGNDYTSWTTGGYTELVQWGLVTNVAGATAAMVATSMLISFVAQGRRSMAVWAALLAAGAAYANPRSLFAIAIAAVAILISTALSGRAGTGAVSLSLAAVRVGIVGVVALLLAMPIVSPLMRFNRYYYFVRYESYGSLKEYWTDSLHAVSPAGILFCAAGVIISLAMRRYFVGRAVTITLIGYGLFTAWLSTGSSGIDLIQQLETPRLMPFQRLLMIYLAAFAAGWCIERASGYLSSPRISAVVKNGSLAVLALATMVIFVKPVSGLPEVYQGLQQTARSGDADFAGYQSAIDNANAIVPEGSSILVIGTTPGDMEWHTALFGPTRSDAPFFYNDWLWDWSNLHVGTPGYHLLAGHFYPDPANALDSTYLNANGIGVVVVTNVMNATPDPRFAARSNPNLILASESDSWDIYTVRNGVPIITNGTTVPSTVKIDNERIAASFSEGTGDITIRRNWFPRWHATINGSAVPITRTADGYMKVAAPPGNAELLLTYDVSGADWIARLCAAVGVAAVIFMAIGRWMPSRMTRFRGLFAEKDANNSSAAPQD